MSAILLQHALETASPMGDALVDECLPANSGKSGYSVSPDGATLCDKFDEYESTDRVQ